MSEIDKEKILLPHHVQQELCTTRLPYRQGRKLTAVKVYTINTESNHLLIFGVPSLNLRRELKTHFIKFGPLLLFGVSIDHTNEDFTDTYHAVYQSIQSARIAKRMMDTKNFYGGSLHVCYAPELETIDETRQKILKRKTDVLNRLKNLRKEAILTPITELKSTTIDNNESLHCNTEIVNEIDETKATKLNMSVINTISIEGTKVYEKKRKQKDDSHKKVKRNKTDNSNTKITDDKFEAVSRIEPIDCTSAETEVVTNVNENIDSRIVDKKNIVKLPYKPLNKIMFNLNNKKK